MAFSFEQRKQLLKVTASRRRRVIRALSNFMARTGLNPSDMAARINYSRATLNLFMNERYHRVSGDDSGICAAVEQYILANPIEPYTGSDNAGRLYETDDVRMIRKYFDDALTLGQAYLLRGAPGTQKSFASEHLVAELNRKEISKNGTGARAYYLYCPDQVRPTQLMKLMAEAAGTITLGTKERIIRNLRFDLRARKVVFIFDEAQHLDEHCLETVRELNDRPPHFGMLFLGSHELQKTFNRLDMEQWRSRIHHAADLPGVSRDEALEIIRAEIGANAADQMIAFPKGSKKKMPRGQALVEMSMSTDLHKGKQIAYLNARTLFRSLKGFKARRAG